MTPTNDEPRRAVTEPYVADEDDRPVPLPLDYQEPLELLDPAAALLSPQEP
jgi:hypothetical protein